MEKLIIASESKEALAKVSELLKGIKGIHTSVLTTEELQWIGKKKLIELKKKIDADHQDDDNDITEEEIQAITDEVRQKMYDNGRL